MTGDWQTTLLCLMIITSRKTASDQPVACNLADGVRLCDEEDGFRFLEMQSHTFTVTLPADAHGSYTCSTIPPDASMNELPCHFLPQDSGNKQPSGPSANVVIAVSLSILVLMIVIAGLVRGIFLWKRKKRRRSKLQTETVRNKRTQSADNVTTPTTGRHSTLSQDASSQTPMLGVSDNQLERASVV